MRLAIGLSVKKVSVFTGVRGFDGLFDPPWSGLNCQSGLFFFVCFFFWFFCVFFFFLEGGTTRSLQLFFPCQV